MVTYQVLVLILGLSCNILGQPVQSDIDLTKECIPGWERFENRCYHFQDDSVQLPAFGELLCHKLMPISELKDKTSLAKISNIAQNEFVHRKLNGKCANIGGTDESSEGSWKFSDGQQMDFFNWAKQPWIQPDNGQRHTEGSENCIEMWEDGTWNDLMCRKDNGPRNCMHVCSYDLTMPYVEESYKISDKIETIKESINIQGPPDSPDYYRYYLQYAKTKGLDYQIKQDINKKYDIFHCTKSHISDTFEDLTLLHIATLEGDLEAAVIMLGNPYTDPNARIKLFNMTPLHLAVVDRQIEILVALLQNEEIDVNICDDFGYTALHRAAEEGNTEAVALLLNHKDIKTDLRTTDSSQTAFELTIMNYGADTLALFLETQEDINVNALYRDNENPFAVPLLHHCTKKGSKRCVASLLKRTGLDLNRKNGPQGYTALHVAAKEGEEEILKLLLADNRIDTEIRDKKRKTAWMLAKTECIADCSGTIALLESRGK